MTRQEGVVDQVVFRADNTGFSVVELRTPDSDGPFAETFRIGVPMAC